MRAVSEENTAARRAQQGGGQPHRPPLLPPPPTSGALRRRRGRRCCGCAPPGLCGCDLVLTSESADDLRFGRSEASLVESEFSESMDDRRRIALCSSVPALVPAALSSSLTLLSSASSSRLFPSSVLKSMPEVSDRRGLRVAIKDLVAVVLYSMIYLLPVPPSGPWQAQRRGPPGCGSAAPRRATAMRTPCLTCAAVQNTHILYMYR